MFGLKLGHLLFSAAKQTSRVLQAKDTTVQEAVSALNATRAFYQHQRQDDAFDTFYEDTVAQAQTLKLESQNCQGIGNLQSSLVVVSLTSLVNQKNSFVNNTLQSVISLFKNFWTDLSNAAYTCHGVESENGENYAKELEQVKESVFKDDLDYDRLEKHLGVLVDVIHQALPEVKKVTSVHTICEAMKSPPYRIMLSEVHKSLRLYLTVPITSFKSERAFSTLRRLLTYLRSSMTEQRLNNCMLLHIHKDLTDDLDYMRLQKSSSHQVMNGTDTLVTLVTKGNTLVTSIFAFVLIMHIYNQRFLT